jgi:hypothetical protein
VRKTGGSRYKFRFRFVCAVAARFVRLRGDIFFFRAPCARAACVRESALLARYERDKEPQGAVHQLYYPWRRPREGPCELHVLLVFAVLECCVAARCVTARLLCAA